MWSNPQTEMGVSWVRSRRFWLVLMSLAGIGLAVGAGVYLVWIRWLPRTLRGHTQGVLAVAFSPDGKVLVSGSKDRSVKLWDVSTGRELLTLAGHEGPVRCVAFSPDGKVLASGSDDKTVKLWDTATGKETACFHGHPNGVSSLAFAPDGETLATACAGDNVTLWHIGTGKPKSYPKEPDVHPCLLAVAFSPDGRFLTAGGDFGTLRSWDITTDTEQAFPQMASDRIQCMTFSPDGKTLATGSFHVTFSFTRTRADTRLTFWDTATRKPKSMIKHLVGEFVSVAFSPDSKSLAAATWKTVTVWDVKSEQLRSVLKHQADVSSVAYAPDGRTLAYGSADATITLWQTAAIPNNAPRAEEPPAEMPTFDGPSEQLAETVMVPTLDSPVPEGKSVIWCSTIQLAWNRLRNDVAGEAIQIPAAAEVVERLNRAKPSEDDLEPGSWYAMAGLIEDGVFETIRRDMAEKFPRVNPPKPIGLKQEIIAFAYLQAGVRFQHEFHDNTEKFEWTDAKGRTTDVRSFGIRESEKHKIGGFRDQVQVLFREAGEFALDLSKDSFPNQIVVARLGWKGTLQATLDDLERKIAKGPGGQLGTQAVLLVPNLDWRIEHHFRELEGRDKVLTNPSLKDGRSLWAYQMVRFKLSRSGADLDSGFDSRNLANGHKDDPDVFHYDRPFLIQLRKRGARHPFFVMWVANPELLCRR